MSLGVLVTNYETWDLTRSCLDGVLAHRNGVDRILVVDDASRQPPPALDPAVEVRRNPENLGLVRSLNLGLRALSTDLAVLFDSDARPLGPFAAEVRARFAADPRLAVLGFATVDARGRPTGSSEEEPDLGSLVLGQRLHAGWERIRPRPGRLCVYTCAMALRLSAFEALGGFDEAFDWLDLDHDLCMRAWRAGWRVEQAPELVAFHQGSGAPQTTSRRVVRFYRNRWYLLRKHGKIRHPGPARALVTGRLAAELFALRLAGPFLVRDPAVRADKRESRQTLLREASQLFR